MILFLPSAPGLPPNAPDIRPILRAGTRDRVNVELYRYGFVENGTNYRIDIEEDFFHDGASVPRLFWTLVGITPGGKIEPAAVVHDKIHRHKGRMPRECYMMQKPDGDWINVPGMITKLHADKIFRDIMGKVGYSRTKQWAAYRGLRATAWRHRWK